MWDKSLELYFRDLDSLEPLSESEEVELARRIQEGDRIARDRLVSANLRFVVSVAKGYQNRGMGLADLISAGNVGLIKAAERFDGTLGFRFITYAVWWVRQAIHSSLGEDVRVVRLPANRISLLNRIYKMFTLDPESEPETVARKLGVSVGLVRDTLVLAQEAMSLDASFRDGEQGLLDVLPAAQAAPDAGAVEDSVRRQLHRALSTLEDREAEVLRLYFGIGGEEPMKLSEIGRRLGVTREWVRQIKRKAISRLRHPLKSRILKDLA